MTLLEALERFGLSVPVGRAVRIAVVDSGVYAAHPHVGGVASGISLIEGTPAGDYVDRNGHGTAVCAAIREKAPAAELVAVKVFDRTLATTARVLARAIEWSAQDGAHLINLSLGTTNVTHTELLQRAVSAARAAGATVVAAATQNGMPSLPGALNGVVAVSLDWTVPREQCEVDGASVEAVHVRASGYPRPIPGVPVERNLKGVSFAVANVSGLIATALPARPRSSA